ncbi:MAG: hypothetical protein J0L75_11670 [Spirochaetes bacterium]|nr:hypothetical protein [Spirochaetota bacterium]
MKIKTIHRVISALLLASFGLCANAPQAPSLLGLLRFDPKGAFRLDGLSFAVVQMSGGGKWVEQARAFLPAGEPILGDEGREQAIVWDNAPARFRMRQWAQAAPEGVALRYEVEAELSGAPIRELSLAVTLPIAPLAGREFRLDDEPVRLPARWEKTLLASRSGVRRLELPTEAGTLALEGNFDVRVQDNREWNIGEYSVRLRFSPGSGEFTRSGFQALLRREAQSGAGEQVAIDLSKAANMDFADEVEGDRKGGWTDQGRENDLRAMKPGDMAIGAFRFRILDAAKNGGRACLVFAGPQRDYFPKDARLPLAGERFGYLNLLHTTAWTPKEGPVGSLVVAYQDGDQSEHPVLAGVDVGNWWGATSLPNGHVGWTMENRQAYVGLYVSRFRIKDKPIRELRLVPTGRAVWAVVALSGSEGAAPFPATAPEYIIADARWKPVKHETFAVKPGSILDLSAHVEEGPAGKWGRVLAGKEGHFEFEKRPGEAVRFLGPNLTFSANFIEKPEDAAALAQTLRRYGYNCVRFHHYDGGLACESIFGDDKPLSPGQFRPERLAKFDQTFAALKAAGLYATIDLYTMRPWKAAEIPEYGKDGSQEIKGLIPLFDGAFENWRRFAEALLTHVNPHTGLAYKDDPALFAICLVNEDTLFANWNKTPASKAAYEKRFAEWVKGRPSDETANRDAAFSLFLADQQIAANERMMAALRKLGVKALFSGANYHNPMLAARIRAKYDYVDNHTYWDHPTFSEGDWKPPVGVAQRGALTALAGTPRDIMATRVFGKPFAATEYCFCYPNHTRAEGGPLMGAYAALQGWDLLNRFDIALYGDRPHDVSKPTGSFTLSRDPIGLLTERIISLLYLRGDVKTASSSAAFVLTPELARRSTAMNTFPAEFQYLGLVARIGSVDASLGPWSAPADALLCTLDDGFTPPTGGRRLARLDGATPPLVSPRGSVDPVSGKAQSETGEIFLDGSARTLRVLTPRSEAFIRYDKGSLAGKAATVEVLDDGFATVFIASMDGLELAKSRRLAVYHLTDTQNSKVKFRDPNHMILESWGELPILVRAGRARIGLELGGRPAKVFAVDLTGARLTELPTETSAGRLMFTASTHQAPGACLAYEVAFE